MAAKRRAEWVPAAKRRPISKGEVELLVVLPKSDVGSFSRSGTVPANWRRFTSMLRLQVTS